MKRYFLFSLIIVLFAVIPLQVFSGTTGKIRGKVIDRETNNPLIGVSIFIVGTKLGASTNFDGEYYILNVPTGTYALRASSIGYNTTTVRDILVSADLTTETNFSLVSEAVEVNEVIITAQRPLIQQDATASLSIIEAQTLQSLPVSSFTQAMVLSTGFVQTKNGADEGIHLRGGRSREISYLVDGVRADNILFSGLGSDVPRMGVSSLTVMSGTFNAEYGQAQSGVVNVITQDGSDKLWAKGRYSSDNFGGGKNNWGTHLQELALSGPIIPEITFFGSADRERTNTYLNNVTGPSYTSPGGRKIQHDFNFLQFDNKDRAQGKLTFKFSSDVKVQAGVVYYNRKYRSYDNTFKEYPQDKGVDVNKSWLYNGSITHTLSENTFYELRLSHFDYTEQAYLYEEQLNGFQIINGKKVRGDHSRIFIPVLGNVSFDSTANYQFYAPYETILLLNEAKRLGYNKLFLADTLVLVNANSDTTILEKNTPVTAEIENLLQQYGRSFSSVRVSLRVHSSDDQFRDANTTTTTIAGSITSQLNNQNNIKFGFELKQHKITDYWINGVNTYWDHIDNSIPFEKRHFDLVDYQFKPVQFAAYVQDKFEYKNMVFNVGIRFDYLEVKAPDVNEFLLLNPNNPGDSAKIARQRETNVPQSSKFSPRLGFAFPITTKAKIHFSYGHFFQYPDFNFLYRRFREQNPNYLFLGIGQSLGAIGNPKLKPETTHAYEFGGEYILNDNMVAGIRMFYKDTYDYISTQPLFNPDNHTRIANLDYANSRGIEFSLERRFASYYSFALNYTYSRAEGNADEWSTHSTEIWNASVYGFIPPKKTVTLGWDQPHTVTMNFRLDFDTWGGSIVGDVGSGLPYSPREPRGKPIGDINSGRQPWTSTFDIRAYRSFSFEPLKMKLTLDITNIFNRRNVLDVWNTTGKPNYNSNPAASAESMNDPSFYGPPRHLLLGLEVEF
ncbi:MAG: TonB-dependent receptor [Ignavibacteriales bacterium]|nr:TonB-dependent receptor [Ignavibacteriales bacterium]